jgi:hypothetical protein
LSAVGAVVAVVVAAVAITVALAGGGGGGSGGGGTRAAGGGGGGQAPATAKGRLLALIPLATREKCMPAAQGVADASASVAVECGLAGLDVLYQRFPNNDVMNQWYALVRENAQIGPSTGSCTAAAFHGESQLTVNGSPRGRYLCVLDAGEPRLYATDERFGVGTMLDYYAGKGPAAIGSILRQWRCCTQLGAT